jgi:hypothetical protein
MANLGLNFDATTVEPSAPIDVIPAGKYVAQIVNSEMRDTKSGSGQYLWLEIDIMDGQYKGRKLWDRLNLVNSNPQAAEIANRTLSAICHATGKMHITDSEQVHYIPMLIKVAVRPSGVDKSGVQREAQNEIKGYEKVEGFSSSKPPAAAAASTTAKSAPWRR